MKLANIQTKKQMKRLPTPDENHIWLSASSNIGKPVSAIMKMNTNSKLLTIQLFLINFKYVKKIKRCEFFKLLTTFNKIINFKLTKAVL